MSLTEGEKGKLLYRLQYIVAGNHTEEDAEAAIDLIADFLEYNGEVDAADLLRREKEVAR